MRKLAALFIFGLLSAAAQAQNRSVGEAYVKDGIPCIIVRTDRSGDHGLVMSLLPTVKARKAASKSGEQRWFFTHPRLSDADFEQQGNYYADYYDSMKSGESMRIRTSGVATGQRITTTQHGREATRNVAAFCAERGIDMETYFPEYHWAISLGQGWFIPGAGELKYFARLLGYDGLGDEYAKGIFKARKDYRAANDRFKASLHNLPPDEAALFSEVETDIYLFYNILVSSTITFNRHADDIGPLSLVKLSQEATSREWWDMAHIAVSAVCAMSEF